MGNLLLDLANEEVEEREGFAVDTDVKADWCLDKIREEKAEISRFEMVMQTKIEKMKVNFESFKKQKENSIEFFKSKLAEYFETLDIKPTKTGNKTYKLPTGTLRRKKQQPEYKRDSKILLEFLKDNDYKEYIKIKEDVDWSEFKKNLVFTNDNKAITEDGIIVEGLEITERPDKFEVDC